MKEKLKTLSVAELRELAKGQGLKGTSSMRKQELVDWLAARWEEEVSRKEGKAAAEKEAAAEEPAPSRSRTRRNAAAPAREPRRRQQQKKEKETEKTEQGETESAGQLTAAGPVQKGAAADRPDGADAGHAKDADAKSPAAERTVRAGAAESRRGVSARRGTRTSARQPVHTRTKTEESGTSSGIAEAPAAPPQAAPQNRTDMSPERAALPAELQSAADKGPLASGILEVMQDGFGFLRSANYLPGEDDVYVSPSQIRRFNMRTGDVVTGVKRIRSEREKFAALLYVNTINGLRPAEISKRANFEDMTPIFPNERIKLDVPGASVAMRIVDLISPIGKGQRGMIVSPPKAGKTTLLKQIAKVISETIPDMHIIILLIDERPEEVTDIKEFIQGPQVEVIYSTFDKEPEQHKRVSEMVIERAKRLVEQHRDVTILLDSITRLARAYNLTVTPSGRTLSGGLDPAALYMPKRFFGAARNMREGGSLTILATALIETGSRMDDVVFEEFKGTGNMELVLNRKLSERRIFPAIDIVKSGTRRDDLLLSKDEQEVLDLIHRMTNGARPEDSVERILNRFAGTRSNADLIRYAKIARAL